VIEIPDWARQGRSGWENRGRGRPGFAPEPGPGQESVWDYPRPPRCVPDRRRVLVRAGSTRIAETIHALRVLETASPPTFYLPREDVRLEYLEPAPGVSRCEWKGEARYFDLVLPERRVARAAWCYPAPFAGYEAIRGRLAFYPARLACFVDGERVRPQSGGFYGGWVTDEVVGPWKGEPGTESW
jgi:uncharacterized protein (DUF427 family)